MKAVAYPVVFKECKKDKIPFYVYLPDFDVCTQGHDQVEAIKMARELIEITIVELEEAGRTIPEPGISDYKLKPGEFSSLVDASPDRYRAKLKNLSVKKNCTIPQWLCEKAEKAGLNFSKVLQEALMEKLNLM